VCDPAFVDLRVEVDYAADLPTHKLKSFFREGRDEHHDYSSCLYNLNNLYKSEHGLIRNCVAGGVQISGVTSPWLYIGMKFSAFCWHLEDLYMHSVNYSHQGAVKNWYFIPPRHQAEFEQFARRVCRKRLGGAVDYLNKMTLMIDPLEVLAEGIALYRARQDPGSFILTFPQAYHAGFSHGFNITEAVNFLPKYSLDNIFQADSLYIQTGRIPVLPVEWLLLHNEDVGEDRMRAVIHDWEARLRALVPGQHLVVFREKMKRYDKVICKGCRRYCVGVFIRCHLNFCLRCVPAACCKERHVVVQDCHRL
jgi:hypothetical protein